MNARLASRADYEAWLDRADREYFVDEPTLQVKLDEPVGESRFADVLWNGKKGIEVFIPLSFSVEPGCDRAVDLALAEANASVVDGGLRRSASGIVSGHIVFLDDDGTIEAGILERAIAACRETAAAHAGVLAREARG